MIFSELNLKRNDRMFILAILIISSLLVAYYIQFTESIGIYCSDVFVYLLNALYYSGADVNVTSTIYLYPLISFLTSLLFDLGFKSELSIYLVTGIFAILGNIGFYILLRTKFSEVLSLAGTIMYACFALNLAWLANGTLDIPAVAVTIWCVLILYIAIKLNPKYYMIAMPLFIIALFTRYTAGLILPVLLLYYVYEKGFKITKEDKPYIIKGIACSIGLFIVVLIILTIMSDFKLPLIHETVIKVEGKRGMSVDQAYNPDIKYYFTNFPEFISASKTTFVNATPFLENSTIISWISLGLLAIGCVLGGLKLKIKRNKESIGAAIAFLIAIGTFTHVSSIITIIITFIGLYLIGKDSNHKEYLAMLGWILSFYIFFTYFNIRVNRYIIPAIPPIIYFTMLSIELIHEKVKINKNIIPLVLIIMFVVQGFAFTSTYEDIPNFKASEEISSYIIQNDPDYENHTIGVHNVRPYGWYLQTNVEGIPTANTTYIDQSNVTYYISNNELSDLTNYTQVKNVDNLYLYYIYMQCYQANFFF